QSRAAIKGGGVPGISESDKVILWAGGIYDWFDPTTLVRAVGRLSERRPMVRLFFLGLKHPNSSVLTTPKIAEIRALSDALGLTEKFVFFNEGWVDYHDRQNYLLDADVGVSTHIQHIEATFSSRTRILDYLWAGLPIVSTAGDTFADLITQQQLGVAVPERDVDALVEALDRCLFDEDFAAACRTNVARVAADFSWGEVLEPLLAFCRSPQRASDIATLSRSPHMPQFGKPGTSSLALARQYLREGGPMEVLRRSGGRIRRVVSERRSGFSR
nr:glycosyltransferase family 4 protein [Actinomycetota bacterium]